MLKKIKIVSADWCNCGHYFLRYTVLIYELPNQHGVLIRHNTESSDDFNVYHSVTLVPRLEYSVSLLSKTIKVISQKKSELKESNKDFASYFDKQSPTHLRSLELETTYSYCHEALFIVKKRISGLYGITSLPEVLPSTIPIIRAISAQLHGVLPACSRNLSELSVHLGSIVLDSAVLTEARFDFSLSNEESASVLDKVKLMVDSKINKQYPNVDSLKLCTV